MLVDSADQRLDATVIHTLWKTSRQIFVESYRLLHDWPVDRALFAGEALLGEFSVSDQPRLGPISIMSRTLDARTEDEARAKFAGNTSPYIETFNPYHPIPAPAIVETTPEIRAEALASIALAREMNLKSDAAPENVAGDDVLWSLESRRDWFGVRSLVQRGERYSERLDLVGLDHVFPARPGRGPDIVNALPLDLDQVLLAEFQNCWFGLNNSVLFQTRRRSTLSDAQYSETYA